MIEQWVEQWRAGDERAAESLYHYFSQRLFRLAYGLLGDSAEAEDVMQETLRYALMNIQKYNAQKGQFGTWVHTITVSRVRDKQRRNKTRLSYLTRLWQRDTGKSAESSEKTVIHSQNTERIHEAVQKLPPAQREIVVLRYWLGYSFPQISKILDIPEGTAKSRLRLAHKQLTGTIDFPMTIGDIAA